MDHSADALKDWMDERGLSASDVGIKLHTAAQTIRQWRSFGVPTRRKALVEAMMRDWDSEKPVVATGQNLVLHPSEEQFKRWGNAAALHQQNIVDWAIEGLEALALEELKIVPGPAAEQSSPPKRYTA